MRKNQNYISMTATFDDMDTAELAARNLTHRFSEIKSVKLHYRRESVINADSYSSTALTAANQFSYVNVGYGVIPPQGAAPMFAVYQNAVPKGKSYVDKKVKMTIVAPRDKRHAITGVLLNTGGHFVKLEGNG